MSGRQLAKCSIRHPRSLCLEPAVRLLEVFVMLYIPKLVIFELVLIASVSILSRSATFTSWVTIDSFLPCKHSAFGA